MSGAEIEFECPGCRSRLRVPASVAGAAVRCPSCGREFVAPRDARVAPSLAPKPLFSPPTPPPARVSPSSDLPSSDVPHHMPPTASQKMPLDAVVEADTSDTTNASVNANVEAHAPIESPAPTPTPVLADAVELQWWMRTPEGLNYGPATDATVERWVREGRVTADCRLCTNQDPTWRAADSLFPALRPRAAVPAGAPTSVASSYPSHDASSAAARTAAPIASEANAASAPPPVSEPTNVAAQLAPHRAPLVLTLGLVGFFVQCPIFSVMAWVMGSSDLDEMARRRMDPAGASWTRVGRNLGLVLSIAWIIMAVILVGSFIFYVAVKA